MPNFSDLEPLNKPGPLKSATPYVACNEQNQEQTLKELPSLISSNTNSTTPQSSLHIGFSVWFNLDLIAATDPDYAIILDIDSNVFTVYNAIRKAFEQAATPEDFMTKFFKALKVDPALHSLAQDLQMQSAEILTKGFLSSQKNYDVVRNKYLQGKIFFGSADLLNPEQISLLKKWCDGNNMKIQTLYLSNIAEWVAENAKASMPQFCNNITQLIQGKTLVIDAYYPTQQKTGTGPPQRITVGDLPSFEKRAFKKPTRKYDLRPRSPIDYSPPKRAYTKQSPAKSPSKSTSPSKNPTPPKTPSPSKSPAAKPYSPGFYSSPSSNQNDSPSIRTPKRTRQETPKEKTSAAQEAPKKVIRKKLTF